MPGGDAITRFDAKAPPPRRFAGGFDHPGPLRSDWFEDGWQKGYRRGLARGLFLGAVATLVISVIGSALWQAYGL
jgi:hypothetical protein